MSQRNSGRDRIARDAYMTPTWAAEQLVLWLRARRMLPRHDFRTSFPLLTWEPACGTGNIVSVLRQDGHETVASDIHPQMEGGREIDFLGPNPMRCAHLPVGAIITNPPYKDAERWIERALELMRPSPANDDDFGGLVAMLLSVDFDSARTRRRLFANHPAWGVKLVLLDRITWFEPETLAPGEVESTPSENHAWYVWDWRRARNRVPAEIAYLEMLRDDREALSDRRRARKAAQRKALGETDKERV